MAQALTFTIKFNVDPPNVQQALDAVNTSLKNVGVSISNVAEGSGKVNALDDSFTKLGLRVQGMQNLFGVLAGTFGVFIQASNAAEMASTKLTQALQNQGTFSVDLLDELKAFASARQELTAIDDDATIAIMAQLTAMGLQGQALKDATVSVQDLATLMDGDMNAAARVVADAFSGNVGMLKRYVKGLDEADIKQRGTISIIEQLQRAVGGQAEAFGNTAAGSMRKLQAAIDDLRQVFGDLLKNTIVPFLQPMSDVVKLLTAAPPVIQAVALGLVGVATAWTLFNSQLALTHIALGGVATLFVIVMNAMQSGNIIITALASAVGALGIAILVLRDRFVLAAIATGQFGIALQGLAVALAANPVFAAILAIGAGIAVLNAFSNAADKSAESLRNAAREAAETAFGVKELDRSLQELSTSEIVSRIAVLKIEMNALELQIQKTIQSRGFWSTLFGSDEDIAEAQGRLSVIVSMIERMNAVFEARTGQQKKTQTEQTEFMLKLRELELQAMQDSVNKEIAAARLGADKQILAYKEQHAQQKLTDDEFNKLRAATERAYAARRVAILQESYEKEREARDKSAAEYYQYTEFLLKLDQDLALDTAATDEEKYEFKQSFLKKEIADLEALGVRSLEQEQRLAEARVEFKKNENAEILRLENERRDLEQQLANLRTGDAVDDARREIELIQAKYTTLRSLAVKHGRDINEINRAQAAEEAEVFRRLAEERRRIWAEQNQIAAGAFAAIGAGAQSMWQQFVVGQRQAKDSWDAVWLSVRNTALNAIGTILARQLEAYLIDTAAHTGAESTKTGTTQSNVLARVASTVWEALQKGIVWSAETAAFIAKEVAMTAAFLAQQAIRVAAALVEAAAAIVKAVAQAIVAAGPFGLLAAAGFTAIGVAAFAGIKKAFGFARGGQFEPDQRGFIEGGQTEIIAPRRTFEEIMREDFVPMIVRTAQIVTLQYQQPALAFAGGGFDDSRIVKRLENLERTLSRKEWSPVFTNMRDEQEILRLELPKAQRALTSRKR